LGPIRSINRKIFETLAPCSRPNFIESTGEGALETQTQNALKNFDNVKFYPAYRRYGTTEFIFRRRTRGAAVVDGLI
jgi:hypothetical protein